MTNRTTTRRGLLKSTAKIAVLAPFAGAMSRTGWAQQPDVINIAASPFINQAAIFMAGEMGWFAKMGIDPKIRSFPDGSLVVAPMISGEVDIGVVTSSAGLFNSLSRGAPIRAMLCNGQGKKGRAVTAIIVRTDHYEAGIKSIADLARIKGMTAAVGAAGSINQYGIATALTMAGMDPVKDVVWQTSVGQPDIVKQLGQKQIDVADLTYHLAYLAEKQGFGKIIASRDEYLPNSQTAMIAARTDMIEKRRDALVRFGVAYIHSARLFNKVAGNPKEHADIVQMITKYIFVKDVNLLNAVAPHWEWIAENGKPNEASVMAQQDFWASPFKMVEKKSPLSGIFESSIAADAAAKLDAEKPFG
jgi:NitT/TauT family transport system substrate-binding protein